MIRTGEEFTAAIAANEMYLIFETVSTRSAALALSVSVRTPAGYELSVKDISDAQDMCETWLVVLRNIEATRRAEAADLLNGRS